jgi:hypothetical protein
VKNAKQSTHGSFGGAGLIYNKNTKRTPCLIHGNDYKQLVFSSLVKGLKQYGWPPEPLLVQTSFRINDDDSELNSVSEEEAFSVGGDDGSSSSDALVVQWTDSLFDKLYKYQLDHDAWFPNEDCGGIDLNCMTERLRVLVEQRLMRRELVEMKGDSYPLMSMFRGQSSLYSNFMAGERSSSFQCNKYTHIYIYISYPYSSNNTHTITKVVLPI